MKPRVYLETSFISYLTGPLSHNLITAANQQITREWWESRRPTVELFISQSVIDEIRQGQAIESAKRLALVKEMTILETTREVTELALALLLKLMLRKARTVVLLRFCGQRLPTLVELRLLTNYV